jgi:hypothetical protein
MLSSTAGSIQETPLLHNSKLPYVRVLTPPSSAVSLLWSLSVIVEVIAHEESLLKVWARGTKVEGEGESSLLTLGALVSP